MNNDNNSANDQQWLQYIETIRFEARPVEIDATLHCRIKMLLARSYAITDIDLEE
jgi:hypothetical protein